MLELLETYDTLGLFCLPIAEERVPPIIWFAYLFQAGLVNSSRRQCLTRGGG